MNVAVMLLHIDCPSRTEASPSPVKMQLIGQNDRLYGHCTACDAWVTVDIDPCAARTQDRDGVLTEAVAR